MMRILWTVNTMPPELASQLGMRSTHAISWVDAMISRLKHLDGIQLAVVANGGKRVHELIRKEIDRCVYYVLPADFTKKDYWGQILAEFQPDIIHAYGTEGQHNVSLIDGYGKQVPIIISLQGIINAYVNYYYAGMSFAEIFRNLTIGDILRNRSIFAGKRSFQKRCKHEKHMLEKVSYVEGRSTWDRVYSQKINRNLKYYYCPRMIREAFWGQSWNSEHIEKNTILVHQANYPIKGMHKMLDALSILKQEYPKVKMYIAGNVLTSPKTLRQKLVFTGYSKFIKRKIHALNLEENVEFTGYLNAEKMAEKLASVHVCVIPSAIENAPNSLAEAMIVGAPCVASYAGGSPEMLNEGECGLLYRYEEPEMLADRIAAYFKDISLAEEKSQKAREVSRVRHEPDALLNRLLNIYVSVIQDFESD